MGCVILIKNQFLFTGYNKYYSNPFRISVNNHFPKHKRRSDEEGSGVSGTAEELERNKPTHVSRT